MQQRPELADAEATRELLVDALPVLAAALDVEGTQVEPLVRRQATPDVVEPAGDQVVARDLDAAVDDLLEARLLDVTAASAVVLRPEELVPDVLPVERLELGQHAERGGVSGELVVGVAEVRLAAFVERAHRVDLTADLVLHHRVDLVEESVFFAQALAENEEDGALDVVALLDAAGGSLGGDGPRCGDPQPRRPQDHAEVGPDRWVLVGEHDELEAVVRHVAREVRVDLDHAALEVIAAASNGE